jgi:parallel beta-helix repeat protein
VSGSGSAADPYIIAGWEIDVPDTGSYGVKIENASAHFVLRGLIIRGAMDPRGAAIRLGFVSAATVENCSIVNSQNGIEVSSSTGVVLSGNAIYVIGHGLNVIGESAAEYDHLIDESNVLNDYPIRYLYGKDGETVSGIRSSNLYIVASRHMTITNNEIVNGDGIQLAFVDDSLISGNEVYRTTPIPTDHGISGTSSSRTTTA